jgi:AGZA family xanthine/uracil permease-like MFS transporter
LVKTNGRLPRGAIAVFVIERAYSRAAVVALAGSVLTFFGFTHGEAIGFARSPLLAVSYLLVASVLMACARQPAAVASRPGATADAHASGPSSRRNRGPIPENRGTDPA